MIRDALGMISALVVIFAAVAIVAVSNGERRTPPAPTQPVEFVSRADPELAGRTVDRVQLFRAGSLGSTLSLDAHEVTAVLRHAVPGIVPDGVVDPIVSFENGEAVVETRVATGDFQGSAPLAAALGALPDTMDVHLRGTVAAERGLLLFEISQARVEGVPLPAGVVATVLNGIVGAETRISSGTDHPSLSVRWAEPWARVAIVSDRLVLERDERILDHAVDGSDSP